MYLNVINEKYQQIREIDLSGLRCVIEETVCGDIIQRSSKLYSATETSLARAHIIPTNSDEFVDLSELICFALTPR